MPFRHVVMFKWAEGLEDGHVDHVRQGLDALPAAIEQIRSYVHGADVAVSAGNYDYALVADFDNVNDFRTYRDHPRHVLFIEELIRGKVADRAAVQYVTADEGGPGEAAMTNASMSPPATPDESDEAMLERARRAASAEMETMLAEPDETG